MTSTYRTTIRSRVSQGLVATALMAGLAFGLAPIASAAAEWDLEYYDLCMENLKWRPGSPYDCCIHSGGVIGHDGFTCVAPAAISNPGQTAPTKPVVTVPRAPTPGLG
jgi:hypothetical protein